LSRLPLHTWGILYDPDNKDLRIIIVKSSKGRDLDVININSAEKEVLFERGTAFKVIGYGMLKNRINSIYQGDTR